MCYFKKVVLLLQYYNILPPAGETDNTDFLFYRKRKKQMQFCPELDVHSVRRLCQYDLEAARKS